MSSLVVVAMSGGVDSSVAAALLVEQGYRVIGVTLNVWPEKGLVEADTRHSACCSLDSVEDARRVADRLGFPHYTLNFRDLFDRTVIQDFVGEYLRGRTPNPCIRCNRFVKFDALLERARLWGAEHLATGHYARIGHSPSGRHSLMRALDGSKDQSYALYSLTQDQLSHTLFPLGEIEKSETRRIAAELDLVSAAKPDSQEICFIPEDDYAAFIWQRAPEAVRCGPIRTADGEVLGVHPGVAFFTVGQRRGLGVAAGKPLYVVEIDPEENAVVVGDAEDAVSSGLFAGDLNWVSIAQPEGAIRVDARIRYRARPVPASARLLLDGKLEVLLDVSQRGVSPGQAVVLYDGETVVGGGTIERAMSRKSLAPGR